MSSLVVGVDFGTGGVRALILDAASGERVAAASSGFPLWEQGLFCDSSAGVFRQKPSELLDAFNDAVSSAVAQLNPSDRSRIIAISAAVTASSPTAIGTDGLPLGFSKTFESDPDAMLILWKDHSAVDEAREISAAVGERYSSEWFWAKVLRAARCNRRVAMNAVTWAEHADWFPACLCGSREPRTWKRCRAGAVHKALWGSQSEGYPPQEVFARVDPYLPKVLDTLGNAVWYPGEAFGRLSHRSAAATGLPPGIVVGVGVFDAHAAAAAGGVSPGTLVKIIGTSSSDIAVSELPRSHGFPGVESVGEGSILPDRITIEMGEAAYGDLTEWFVNILSFGRSPETESANKTAIYSALESAAEREGFDEVPVALDWFNGRRSPHGDLTLKAALSDLSLGTSAPALYFSLLEAAAFATRGVHEHLIHIGVPIDRVVVLGGVADRSRLGMRILADVLDRPLSIKESGDASAHGAAIYAAVAGGFYSSVSEAQASMPLAERNRIEPNHDRVLLHAERYRKYRDLARFQSEMPAAAWDAA